MFPDCEAVYASVKDDEEPAILKVAELEGITLEDADRQAFAEMNGQTLRCRVEQASARRPWMKWP